ncbi:hypothetical protein DL98DRAFT_641734 [Cadophora sp. DSE1049]|nr:hypothetical protein DL98DRAFT_641734 [Cadophora sp. DSE1049]
MTSNEEGRPAPKHQTISPAIFYWGTPVVLITTENPDHTFNIAPMSSAWWLGNRCMLGLGAISQTTVNLLRTKQCVLNLASDSMADAVNALARTTGSAEILTARSDEGYKYFKKINGYVYVPDNYCERGSTMNGPKPYDPTEIQHYSIPSFSFNGGCSLPIRIAYRSYNSKLPRAVCVPTSEHSHINTTNNFTSGALKDYHVVVVAMLGNGESSPVYQDCVNASYELLTRHLNVKELEVVVGFVVICGSARTSPFNNMLLDGTAAALGGSAGYAIGEAREQVVESTASLHAYGKVTCAWLTSSAWFKKEFFRTILGVPTISEFVEMYDNAFKDWNAGDLLALVRMWQLGDVGSLRNDGSYTKSLEDIEGRILVIASRSDYYFSPEESTMELSHLKFGTLQILETDWGHAGWYWCLRRRQ